MVPNVPLFQSPSIGGRADRIDLGLLAITILGLTLGDVTQFLMPDQRSGNSCTGDVGCNVLNT
jgi:hypothetical protein